MPRALQQLFICRRHTWCLLTAVFNRDGGACCGRRQRCSFNCGSPVEGKGVTGLR